MSSDEGNCCGEPSVVLLPYEGTDPVDHNDDDVDDDEMQQIRNTAAATAAAAAAADQGRLSRNIPLTLWYMLIRCGGEAIWYYSVLTAYVYLLRPDQPAMVGYLSAMEGVTQFVAAGAAGIIADLYRRDSLLRLASMVGVVASLLTFLSSWYQASTELWWWSLVAVGPMLWGIFDGIGLTASMALFADSIPDGQRSYYFTLRTFFTTSGSILGPLGGLIMFSILGDEWTIADCSRVICLAQFVLIPAFAMLWCYSDDDKPPAATNTTASASTNGGTNTVIVDEDPTTSNQIHDSHIVLESDLSEPLLRGQAGEDPEEEVRGQEEELIDSEHERDMEQQANTSRDDDDDDDDDVNCCSCCWGGGSMITIRKARFIAISAALSDVICALASGMSFRYFALFLLNNLQLGPVLVQVLDATGCVSGAILLLIAQRLALRFGRCPVSIVLKYIGVLLLIAMILLYPVAPRWLVCSLYVLQNSFLYSTQALTRSLVMDNVPSHERAKWSALESINIFGWCGSAALGGIIVHLLHGHVIPVFWMTALAQVLGTLPLVPLIWMEEREQPPQS